LKRDRQHLFGTPDPRQQSSRQTSKRRKPPQGNRRPRLSFFRYNCQTAANGTIQVPSAKLGRSRSSRGKADARFTIPNSHTEALLVKTTKQQKEPTRASPLSSKGHFPNSLRNPDGSPAAQRGSAVGRAGIGKARDGVKQFFKILSLSPFGRHSVGNRRRRT
jgi:hypothetical protein